MKESFVLCAHAFLALSLLGVAGCGSQEGDSLSDDGDSLSDKAVAIDLVNPPCAEPGAVSGYIEGNGFGAENVTITVGGIEAQVLTATGHDASFVVPPNVPPGPAQVVVTNPGGRIGTIDWFISGRELCDGVDNDCSGTADDGIADLVSGTDVGECQPQIETCVDGAFVVTQSEVGPSPEVCDGLDNDCSGIVDDGIPDIVMGIDTGECQPQIETCAGGSLVISQFEVGPSPEVCDGLDNDCDGVDDNGVADLVAGSDVGECQVEVQSCIGGTFAIVQPGVGPDLEVCDGVDNDCDGDVDEDPTCPDVLIAESTTVIGPEGGSAVLEGFATLRLPESPQRPDQTITLQRIISPSSTALYEGETVEAGPSWRELLRIVAEENVEEALGLQIVVPPTFVAGLPENYELEIFGRLVQYGDNNEELERFEILGAAYDPATGVATTTVPIYSWAPYNSVTTQILVGSYPSAARTTVTGTDILPSSDVSAGLCDAIDLEADLMFTIPDQVESPLRLPLFVTSPFGPRSSGFHKGVDLRSCGETVYPILPGTVKVAGSASTCTSNTVHAVCIDCPLPANLDDCTQWLDVCNVNGGYQVLIDHGDGLSSWYFHLLPDLIASAGEYVTVNDPIGISDSSGRQNGPHLHLDYLFNGRRVDPMLFIDQQDAATYLANLDVVAVVDGVPIEATRKQVEDENFEYRSTLDLGQLDLTEGSSYQLAIHVQNETSSEVLEYVTLTIEESDAGEGDACGSGGMGGAGGEGGMGGMGGAGGEGGGNCPNGTASGCGNCIVEPDLGEQCDPPGSWDFVFELSCLPDCTLSDSCGDGVIQGPIEECDDGNPRDNDACLNDCTDATCGDGIIWKDVEECDPPTGCEDPGCCTQECKVRPAFSGDGHGDPHYITFDGLAYDLQTVGEHVLTRSVLNEFEVQVRTARFGTSRVVSVITAVAAKVMDDVVEVYLYRFQPIEVFVNHELVATSGSFDLPSGGKVSTEGAVTKINWPSGEAAVRIQNRGDHLNVKTTLIASLGSSLEGLLGDADGSPDNDIRFRGATEVLSSPVSNFDLYAWGDSWRVTQEESLFGYGEGENTETYTDREFPYGTVDTKNLSPEVRVAAEDACNAAGVVDPAIFEACILDVAVTGDPAFAEGLSDISEPVAALTVEETALRFPGNVASYVVFPFTLASLGITDQFTVSIQFFAEPVGTGNRILLEDGTEYFLGAITLGVFAGQDIVFVRLNADVARQNQILSPGVAGTWTTLSMTYDGGTMRLYHEDAQIYEAPITGQIAAGDRNLRLGFPTGESPFQGLVGSLQIWNVALTRGELAETADRDLLGTEPGLIGYWPFHEGGGATVHDVTAGAHHGVMVGNVSWE